MLKIHAEVQWTELQWPNRFDDERRNDIATVSQTKAAEQLGRRQKRLVKIRDQLFAGDSRPWAPTCVCIITSFAVGSVRRYVTYKSHPGQACGDSLD